MSLNVCHWVGGQWEGNMAIQQGSRFCSESGNIWGSQMMIGSLLEAAWSSSAPGYSSAPHLCPLTYPRNTTLRKGCLQDTWTDGRCWMWVTGPPVDTGTPSLPGILFQNNYRIFTLKNKNPRFQYFHRMQMLMMRIQ